MAGPSLGGEPGRKKILGDMGGVGMMSRRCFTGINTSPDFSLSFLKYGSLHKFSCHPCAGPC